MKILVTGAKGFIGKNLVENLKNVKDGKDRNRGVVIDEIYEYDIDTPEELLDEYCQNCDFVFDLAGVNRPKDAKEFNVNHSFLGLLLEKLKKDHNKAPVMLSSSVQALLDNDYGKSKKEAEELKKAVEQLTLEFAVKVGKEGRTFGSVSTKEITEELQKKHNITVDKKKFIDNGPFREVGMHKVKVELFKGVIAQLNVKLKEK